MRWLCITFGAFSCRSNDCCNLFIVSASSNFSRSRFTNLRICSFFRHIPRFFSWASSLLIFKCRRSLSSWVMLSRNNGSTSDSVGLQWLLDLQRSASEWPVTMSVTAFNARRPNGSFLRRDSTSTGTTHLQPHFTLVLPISTISLSTSHQLIAAPVHLIIDADNISWSLSPSYRATRQYVKHCKLQ